MTTTRRPIPREVREARRRKRRRQLIRNRIIFVAVCLLIIGLIVFGISKLVSAIVNSTRLPDVSTMTFCDNGKLVFEEVTPFDPNTYSEKELKKYTKQLIKDFNTSAGQNMVELDKLKVDDDSCYVKSTYESADCYSDFSSYKTFYGTVGQAIEAGYKFKGEFAQVSDGKKSGLIKADFATDYAKYQVAIVNENVLVSVPGEIVCISNSSTTLNEDATVTIAQADGNVDSTDTVYIIFSNEK